MFTTQKLADFVFGLNCEDLPSGVWESARRCLIDLIGVACLGYNTSAARAMRITAEGLFTTGRASIWFDHRKLTPSGAALANAAAASALDLDDGHRQAAGHPGASIIPAALAQGQAVDASWREIVLAVIIGYEVGCRISAAREFEKLPTMSTGRWCAYGAAAAAGRLRGLDPGRLAQALSIAGVQSPEMSAAGYSQVMGNQVKEGIPLATMIGLTAVHLAESGLTGPLDILDHKDFFEAGKISEDLGNRWAIDQVYFKPYACCRWNHAAVDALLAIKTKHSLDPASIETIEVHTFKRALMLSNETNPATIEGAQYSLPFCLAIAAIDGARGLLPLCQETLGRRDLVQLAHRVVLRIDKDLGALFPEKAAARVKILTRSGHFEKTVIEPLGDPANPFSQADLENKFLEITRPFVSKHRQEGILAFIKAGENGKPGELFGLLAEGDDIN
jgi:2-methylcitrate dehydratase PrpD